MRNGTRRQLLSLSCAFVAAPLLAGCGGDEGLAAICPPAEAVHAVVPGNPPKTVSMTGSNQCNYQIGPRTNQNPEIFMWVTSYVGKVELFSKLSSYHPTNIPMVGPDNTSCEVGEWPWIVNMFDSRPEQSRGPVCDWANAVLEVALTHSRSGQ
jgi:hypothetical protein